jgi:mannose-6-phosphate isomerase-like protein (cupin superfamily)
MEAFEIEDVLASADNGAHTMKTVVKGDSMRVSVAVWPANSTDDQDTHDEDEVYYVVSGRAKLSTEGKDRDVGPGTTIFMPAGVDHHFHSIEEDLKVLVVWGGNGTS